MDEFIQQGKKYTATIYLIGQTAERFAGLDAASAVALQTKVHDGETIRFSSQNSLAQRRDVTIPARSVISFELVEEG